MTSKLNNLQRNSKPYWSLLKYFSNNKKILLIPPLFRKNKLVTKFLKNTELFNSFSFVSSKQCSLINNASTLPTHIHYLTNNRLSSVTFSQDHIATIIQNLGETQGHDNIYIGIYIEMLKLIRGPAILKSLDIIFKQCVNTGVFPSKWKKGNIVPIYRKGDKQTLKLYCPVWFLPICWKIFERLMFNEMFNFFYWKWSHFVKPVWF